jgi:dynein heavy chain
VLDTRAYKWSQPIKLKSESEISPDTTLRNRLGPTPLPRGEHASAKIGNKLYVFGGYGGLGFARRDFNDMYALDTETWSWERIEYAKIELGEDDEDDEDEEALNPEPPARAGHKMDAIGDTKLVVHGGWSNKEQFNDVWIFDVVTRRWEELVWDEEAPSGPARWSHGAVVIDAIPDPQLYIWGGLTGALSTGKKPSGTYMNDTRLYNITNQTWKELPFQKKFRGRCDTPLTYRQKTGNFYVFGGWSNKWYNDLWKADMNSIIGPPYHVTKVEPTFGSIKGGTNITLTGIGFNDTRNVKVQFDAGDAYQNEEAFGVYVSDTEIKCETPNLEAFLNKTGRVCNISVSLDGQIHTIYNVNFEFFTVTSAVHSAVFGPALLNGVPTGQRSEFTIITRDKFGEIRKYGGDKFTVLVQRVVPKLK